MTRISTILAETEGQDYYAILQAVYAYYLTEKEQVHYQALLLYILGKPQRDIGILLNTQQYKVCEYISKLKHKLFNITSVLAENHVELRSLLLRLSIALSAQQYEIVEFLLAGNKKIAIAAHYGCSPAWITKVSKLLQKRIPTKDRRKFNYFYSKLG